MLVQTVEQWNEVLDQWHTFGGTFVADCETTGLTPFHGTRLIGLACLLPDTDADHPLAFYAPFRHLRGVNLPLAELRKIAPLIADPDRWWINHFIKFDMHHVEQEGMVINARPICTAIQAHINNENEPFWNLEYLANKHVGFDAGKNEAGLIDYAREHFGIEDLKWIKANMAEFPPEAVAEYAIQDCFAAWWLYLATCDGLKQQGLEWLAPEMSKYVHVAQRMEARGVLIDVPATEAALEHASEKQEECRLALCEFAGKEINPNSWQQLGALMGLPKGASTDKDHLPFIDHPAVPYIEAYRKWKTARVNYYEKFLAMRDENNRLHCDLALNGTISSRLSCRKPPLQALPRQTEVYDVRGVIIAPHGYTLVSADYSQVELRFLAYYTQEPALLSAFKGGVDMHTQTAEATGLPRDAAPGAKTLNFASVYGLGIEGIMKKFKLPFEDAKKLHDTFHAKYPRINKLSKKCEQQARRQGYIEMWTGRRRHYGRTEEPHKAMSNLIQGGVAELMRVSIIRLAELLEGSRVHMVLQIHDDILFEIPDEELEFWIPIIKQTLEDYEFSKGTEESRVPIVADVKYGKAWGKMVKWTPPPPPEEGQEGASEDQEDPWGWLDEDEQAEEQGCVLSTQEV